MIREFELDDGRKGNIELPDDLVEQFGEEWANQVIDDAIADYKKKIKSQE
jgi:hypothetical protein